MDNEYDLIEENVKEGIYGINIHRVTLGIWEVNLQGLINGRLSCQVIVINDDFNEFMDICRKELLIYGVTLLPTL